jgi:hypothetical protein
VRKTLNVRRLSKAAVTDLLNRWLFDPGPITEDQCVEYPEDVERPRTRGECEGGERPCPWCGANAPMRILTGERNGKIASDRPNGDEVRKFGGHSEAGSGEERCGDDTDVGSGVRLREKEDREGCFTAQRPDSDLRLLSRATRDVRDARIRGMALDDSEVRESKGSQLPEPRSQGDSGLPGVAKKLPGILRGHGEEAFPGALSGQDRQRRELRAKQLPMGNREAAGKKQAQLSCDHCGGEVGAIIGVGRDDWHWEKYDPGAPQEGLVTSASDLPCHVLNRCRPCAHASCSMHLYLDVNPRTGAIKMNFPHLQVWEMEETCALDVAAKAGKRGLPIEQLANAINLSYDRAFQVVDEAKKKVRAAARRLCSEGDDDDE